MNYNYYKLIPESPRGIERYALDGDGQPIGDLNRVIHRAESMGLRHRNVEIRLRGNLVGTVKNGKYEAAK